MNKKTELIFLGTAGMLGLAALSALFTFGLMKLMKGEAYQQSLSVVKESPDVIDAIGEPIVPAWYVMGNINTRGPDGSAALEYDIDGARSSAKVYAYATRSVGEWRLDKVIVQYDETGDRTVVVDATQ